MMKLTKAAMHSPEEDALYANAPPIDRNYLDCWQPMPKFFNALESGVGESNGPVFEVVSRR